MTFVTLEYNTMKVKEIVDRVRSAIDEQMKNDSGFLEETADESNLTAVIIDKIGYALTYVIENAPEDRLDSDMLESLSASENPVAAGECVRVAIPADVLRIMSARLSTWSLSPAPVSEDSEEYLMQQDEYARGSWDRPVTAVAYHGGVRYLELYSAKSSDDTVSISCIKKPVVSDVATLLSNQDTDVSVPSRLEGAFIYQVAGLAMVAFRESVAQSLFSIARRYMGIDTES